MGLSLWYSLAKRLCCASLASKNTSTLLSSNLGRMSLPSAFGQVRLSKGLTLVPALAMTCPVAGTTMSLGITMLGST
uniref:Uncharacterized protein n=1 Tax=Vibrio harveyi TaxID=669 RepID=E5G5P5_VIBHA|nr:hypothetical protein [Vibrio harveyi]